jgi:hypothetical protein
MITLFVIMHLASYLGRHIQISQTDTFILVVLLSSEKSFRPVLTVIVNETPNNKRPKQKIYKAIL